MTSKNGNVTSEVQKLRSTVSLMDCLSQEGFSQIAAIANLSLVSLEMPIRPLHLDDIAQALKAIKGKAEDIMNCINSEAEQVGCNFVDEEERRRWAALRAGDVEVKAMVNSSPDCADSFHDGAAACLKALQSASVIERRGFDNPETNDNTVRRFFRDRDEIEAVFMDSFGSVSSFQFGFIALIAEYVHTVMACGEPDEFRWEPEALMTENQVKEYREENIEMEESDRG